MKKTLCFLALGALLVLLSGCVRSRLILYAMGNQTGKEITIYPPSEYQEGPVVLAPGDYFTVGHFLLPIDGPAFDSFYETSPFYIVMDGIKYQIDRNQQDNCLWVFNYHEAPEELAASLRQDKNELVWVYDLTEDYIRRQIIIDK